MLSPPVELTPVWLLVSCSWIGCLRLSIKYSNELVCDIVGLLERRFLELCPRVSLLGDVLCIMLGFFFIGDGFVSTLFHAGDFSTVD